MVMAIDDLPVAFEYSRSRELHRNDHFRLHQHLTSAVYSADYATVQDALDDAVAKRRPLVIEPKVHTLLEPLRVVNSDYLTVNAPGAVFCAGADLPSLIDLSGTGLLLWQGGRLEIPDPYTVTNAVYIYHAEGGNRSTQNTLRDMVIIGNYVTGVRVGRQGDGFQCDHVLLDCLSLSGNLSVSQYGVYFGDGVFGNNLNHVATNIRAAANQTHVYVDATNAYLTGCFFDRSVRDFYINTLTCSIRDVRSEEAMRFLETGGPAANPALLDVHNVQWNAQELTADGEWLRLALAGKTTLHNVSVVNAPVATKIKAAPGAKLLLSVDGLVTQAAYADLFDVNANTVIQNCGHIQTGTNGAVSEVTA